MLVCRLPTMSFFNLKMLKESKKKFERQKASELKRMNEKDINKEENDLMEEAEESAFQRKHSENCEY